MNNKTKVIVKFAVLGLMMVSITMMLYTWWNGATILSEVNKVQSADSLKDFLDIYSTPVSETTVQIDLSSLTYGDVTSSIFEEESLYITKDMFPIIAGFIFVIVLISHMVILFLKSIYQDLKPRGTSKSTSTNAVDNCNDIVIY